MNFIPYDINKVNRNKYRKTENLRLIEEFAESGESCAKIKNFPQIRSSVAATSLNHSARNFGYPHIRFISRKEELFVINENLVNAKEEST